MRGVYLPGHSDVDIREVPDPVPGPGQVLLAMKASTICGSDIRAIYREHLQGDPAEAPAAPLPVIRVPDLVIARDAVAAAGGVVTRPIFAYPGGQRFHFRDPAGNELAAYTPG